LAARTRDGGFELRAASGLDSHAADEYNAQWRRYDPMRQAAAAPTAPSVYTASPSDYWMRFAVPLGFRTQVLTGPGAGDQVAIVTWYRELGGHAHQRLSVLSCLLPHVTSVVRRHQEALPTPAPQDGTMAGDVLNTFALPIVVSTGESIALLVNHAARELALKLDGFGIASDGPTGSTPRETERLRRAIRRTASDGTPRAVRLSRPSGLRDYEVTVAALEPTSREASTRRAVLWVRVPEALAVDADALRQLHGLTALEARVCARLVDGRQAAEIASELDLSVQTARWYIRQLYSKFEVRTHAQLLRAITAGVLSPFVPSTVTRSR
jgi:DNA-binding CsgD family transcriptional regulator